MNSNCKGPVAGRSWTCTRKGKKAVDSQERGGCQCARQRWGSQAPQAIIPGQGEVWKGLGVEGLTFALQDTPSLLLQAQTITDFLPVVQATDGLGLGRGAWSQHSIWKQKRDPRGAKFAKLGSAGIGSRAPQGFWGEGQAIPHCRTSLSSRSQ